MELFELFHSIQATVSNHEQCKHFQPFQKVKYLLRNILLRHILDVAITEHKGNYILQIGLQNGVLLRTTIDSVTGEISDTRTRYLGTKSVKLFKVKTEGESAVLAVSSRSWLSYRHQQRFHLTPLSYESLDSATGFR